MIAFSCKELKFDITHINNFQISNIF